MGLITDEPTWMQVLRIGLHLLAASAWVGGQIVLVGLAATVQAPDDERGRAVTNRINLIAWSAYGMLIFTGIWNTLALSEIAHPVYELKLLAVVISGAGALLQFGARGRASLRALGGATANLGAVAALFLGVWLPLA